GNGGSGGITGIANYAEEVENLRCIVSYVRSTLKRKVFCICGHSKGAAVVLLHASKYNDVPIVINISGRYDHTQVPSYFTSEQMDQLRTSGSFVFCKFGPNKNRDYVVHQEDWEKRKKLDMSVVKNIDRQKSRVLTVHGSKDDICPLEGAQTYHTLIGPEPYHKLAVIQDADHVFKDTMGELVTNILSWLSENVSWVSNVYSTKSDGQRFLLLSENSIKIIKADLESYVSMEISSIAADYGSYKDVELVFIESREAYEKIDRDLLKFNKLVKEKDKIARADAKLRVIRESLEEARKMYQDKKYLFVAIDIESYERDHSCILEVGWSMFNSKTSLFIDRHFCATEHKYKRNGKFVADMKDRFIFGKTVWANLKTIADEIIKDLTENSVKGSVVLVGHDFKMEEKYLESMGVKVDQCIKPVRIFDTAEMNAARVGKPYERMSLGRILDSLDIENYSLHNAGNDARYTLLLFLELCKLPLAPPKEDSQTSDDTDDDDGFYI
ncbi:597_t:CDS:2, partial [Acaulospora colombiana]